MSYNIIGAARSSYPMLSGTYLKSVHCPLLMDL